MEADQENNNDGETLDREMKHQSKKDLLDQMNRIKGELNSANEAKDAVHEENDALQMKYNALTTKLRDKIECPVCLEVPTSGPVHVCPNGHFVCSKCKSVTCPTCRGKMFSGKSLLASCVIENIEHKCRHEDCEVVLPLEDYKLHLKCCPQRIVYCPAPREGCGKEMALSKVYEHILEDCKGSSNNDVKHWDNSLFPFSVRYPIGAPNQSLKGFALCWKGIHFYLGVEKIKNFSVFTIQHFGNAEECKDYEVNIAIHRIDDIDMNGKYVQKFSGEPLPIDMSQELRKQNGLLIGSIQMENIAVKNLKKDDEADFLFAITINIKKK